MVPAFCSSERFTTNDPLGWFWVVGELSTLLRWSLSGVSSVYLITSLRETKLAPKQPYIFILKWPQWWKLDSALMATERVISFFLSGQEQKRASLVARTVKNLSPMQEIWVLSLDWEDSLEKGMATHSSILAWRIPWTEEPGRLQFPGSQNRTWLSN